MFTNISEHMRKNCIKLTMQIKIPSSRMQSEVKDPPTLSALHGIHWLEPMHCFNSK